MCRRAETRAARQAETRGPAGRDAGMRDADRRCGQDAHKGHPYILCVPLRQGDLIFCFLDVAGMPTHIHSPRAG